MQVKKWGVRLSVCGYWGCKLPHIMIQGAIPCEIPHRQATVLFQLTIYYNCFRSFKTVTFCLEWDVLLCFVLAVFYALWMHETKFYTWLLKGFRQAQTNTSFFFLFLVPEKSGSGNYIYSSVILEENRAKGSERERKGERGTGRNK